MNIFISIDIYIHALQISNLFIHINSGHSAQLVRNKVTNEGTGLGYISFHNKIDATNAISEFKKLADTVESDTIFSPLEATLIESVSSVTDINLLTDLIPLESKTYVKVSNVPSVISREELTMTVAYVLKR